MKKSVFIMLVLVLLLTLPVVTAFDDFDASTEISYTVEEPEPEPPPQEPEPEPPLEPEPPPPSRSPPSGTYEINITARISLNQSNEIRFTANYVDMEEGRNVIVSVDGGTFDNGILWLTNLDFDRIGFTLFYLEDDGSFAIASHMRPGTATDVAYFKNAETNPYRSGAIRLEASTEDIAAATVGTYTGTINFTIYTSIYS